MSADRRWVRVQSNIVIGIVCCANPWTEIGVGFYYQISGLTYRNYDGERFTWSGPEPSPGTIVSGTWNEAYATATNVKELLVSLNAWVDEL